jgi:hypothetical protein
MVAESVVLRLLFFPRWITRAKTIYQYLSARKINFTRSYLRCKTCDSALREQFRGRERI